MVVVESQGGGGGWREGRGETDGLLYLRKEASLNHHVRHVELASIVQRSTNDRTDNVTALRESSE